MKWKLKKIEEKSERNRERKGEEWSRKLFSFLYWMCVFNLFQFAIFEILYIYCIYTIWKRERERKVSWRFLIEKDF